MSATNGSAVSFRRLMGCCLALVIVASAMFAANASAAKVVKPATNYIGLGDSLAFGYTQQKFEENYPTESPTAFEGGYVTLLGKKLATQQRKLGNSLTTINLGCPGEVSDGLIGENPALGGGGTKNRGKESDAAPCAYHNVDGFPRHFEYGPASQLEAAIGVVTTPGTFGTTEYVTLNIGSNDELAVVHACESKTYNEERGFANGLDECLTVEAGESGTYYEKGLFHHIIANVGDVIGVLRHEGYTGKVGVLGFYNPQAIILPGSDAIQKKLNETFEYEIGTEAFGPGVVYANPFVKINPQKGTAKEQAAICKYTEECNEHDKKVNAEKYYGREVSAEEASQFPEGDIHPTPAGYQYIATILYKAFGY
jgi:lysophospholipase L1-like esterase